MPGDAFKKVQLGQPLKFPADFYNALVDQVVQGKASSLENGAEESLRQRSTTIIKVKNLSGVDRGRFEILGLQSPVISPSSNLPEFQQQVAMNGVTPQIPQHFGRFAVLLEPIPAGRMGRAVVSGVVPVRLTSATGAERYAEIVDDSCAALTPCPQGSVQILWRDSSSNWAVVRLGNRSERPFKLIPCDESLPVLYVNNDLAEQVNSTIKVGATCYRVSIPTCAELECVEPKCVTIGGVYDDCDKCHACWELTRCDDSNVTIKTNTDLASYKSRIVKLDDGYCYSVAQTQDCYTATPVTVIDDYDACLSCQGCYTLVGCWDSNETLTITNDLAELTGKSAEDVVSDATVVEIDGTCYTVTAYGTSCYGAEHVEITNYYTECSQCGCFIFTSCEADPETTLAVHSAVDGAGDDLDLNDYLGQVVRLSNGELYTVSRGADCENATSVTVLEAYEDCESAVCYELTDCETSATLITYADLAGYEAGAVLKRIEDEFCYTLVGEHEWDSNAVAFSVDQEYPNCATCLAQIKYRLVPSCPAPGCDATGNLPEIITTADLHAAVGQYVQIEGHCYAVEVTETGDVSDETLDYQGPYPDCESCRSQPVSAKKPRITRVYIEGDQIKADVEYDLISNGLIVGFCAGETQIVGDYCCDETSSGHPPV